MPWMSPCTAWSFKAQLPACATINFSPSIFCSWGPESCFKASPCCPDWGNAWIFLCWVDNTVSLNSDKVQTEDGAACFSCTGLWSVRCWDPNVAASAFKSLCDSWGCVAPGLGRSSVCCWCGSLCISCSLSSWGARGPWVETLVSLALRSACILLSAVPVWTIGFGIAACIAVAWLSVLVGNGTDASADCALNVSSWSILTGTPFVLQPRAARLSTALQMLASSIGEGSEQAAHLCQDCTVYTVAQLMH